MLNEKLVTLQTSELFDLLCYDGSVTMYVCHISEIYIYSYRSCLACRTGSQTNYSQMQICQTSARTFFFSMFRHKDKQTLRRPWQLCE